jgi:hypothetical protein
MVGQNQFHQPELHLASQVVACNLRNIDKNNICYYAFSKAVGANGKFASTFFCVGFACIAIGYLEHFPDIS